MYFDVQKRYAITCIIASNGVSLLYNYNNHQLTPFQHENSKHFPNRAKRVD